jgi:hypothetical protein
MQENIKELPIVSKFSGGLYAPHAVVRDSSEWWREQCKIILQPWDNPAPAPAPAPKIETIMLKF